MEVSIGLTGICGSIGLNFASCEINSVAVTDSVAAFEPESMLVWDESATASRSFTIFGTLDIVLLSWMLVEIWRVRSDTVPDNLCLCDNLAILFLFDFSGDAENFFKWPLNISLK